MILADYSPLEPVLIMQELQKIGIWKHHPMSFSEDKVSRLSQIMGREYDNAKMALSDLDDNREIPVLSKLGSYYSEFPQGAGETTVAELLMAQLPKYGLVIIDEVESSLHPRAQRRLVRDLAVAARERECQIIISTHSPYILEELPLPSRVYILETNKKEKEVVYGVSPQFAMTKIDDE